MTFDNERIAELVAEAEMLRSQASAGEMADDLRTIHERLLHVRGAMDRVDEIVISLMKLRLSTRTQLKASKASMEDKWDEVATQPRVGFQHSETSWKERHGHYNVATVKETMSYRQSERRDDQIGTALEIVRWCHAGLDGIRWTLNNRIRLITVDTQLER